MRIVQQDLQLNYFVLSEANLNKSYQPTSPISYQPILLKWVGHKGEERSK